MSEIDGNEAKGVQEDLLSEDEREFVETVRRARDSWQYLDIGCIPAHLLDIIDRLAPKPGSAE